MLSDWTAQIQTVETESHTHDVMLLWDGLATIVFLVAFVHSAALFFQIFASFGLLTLSPPDRSQTSDYFAAPLL